MGHSGRKTFWFVIVHWNLCKHHTQTILWHEKTTVRTAVEWSVNDEVMYTGSAISLSNGRTDVWPTSTSYWLSRVPVDGFTLVIMITLVETVTDCWWTRWWCAVNISVRVRPPCHRTIWPTTCRLFRRIVSLLSFDIKIVLVWSLVYYCADILFTL